MECEFCAENEMSKINISRIVSFHGRPKPAEIVNIESWLQEHWR